MENECANCGEKHLVLYPMELGTAIPIEQRRTENWCLDCMMNIIAGNIARKFSLTIKE